jgi:hypothetical protein
MTAAEQCLHYETRLVRVAGRLQRWARRRSVRASISDAYLGDEERRATLEKRLLLQEEERAIALRELDRTKSLIALYRGLG